MRCERCGGLGRKRHGIRIARGREGNWNAGRGRLAVFVFCAAEQALGSHKGRKLRRRGSCLCGGSCQGSETALTVGKIRSPALHPGSVGTVSTPRTSLLPPPHRTPQVNALLQGISTRPPQHRAMCLRLAVWALEATSTSSSAGFLISTVLPGIGGGAAGAASAKEAALAKHPFLASEQDRLVGVLGVGGFSRAR